MPEFTVEIELTANIPHCGKISVSEEIPYTRLGSDEPFQVLADRLRDEIRMVSEESRV